MSPTRALSVCAFRLTALYIFRPAMSTLTRRSPAVGGAFMSVGSNSSTSFFSNSRGRSPLPMPSM